MSDVGEPEVKGDMGPETNPVYRTVARRAGEFKTYTYAGAEGRRDFKLYIPGSYGGQPVPLVVMLHGCAQTPDDLAFGTRMNGFSEKHAFLVAYPSQASSANRARCWNWFRPGDQARGRGEPAIIAGITRQIMSIYPVDPGRVYVAGVSAGGAMAVIMGATYPDLYAAVGVHSGIPYCAAHSVFSGIRAMREGSPSLRSREQGHRQAWAGAPRTGPMQFVPLIVFHGDNDLMVNKVNAEQIVAQWSLASTVHSAGDSTGQTHNGALEPRTGLVPARVPGGRASTRTVYYDSQQREVMEKWIIHQAGHAWAGGISQGMYTDPLGPDASAEMVRFFLEHPRG
jgi:poly(hydroxyalkanoate) depolymerase family esterase